MQINARLMMELLSPETQCLGCHLTYPFIFWMEDIKGQRCKGGDLKPPSEGTLTYELTLWSPPFLLRKIHSCLMSICDVPGQSSLQTSLLYFLWRN